MISALAILIAIGGGLGLAIVFGLQHRMRTGRENLTAAEVWPEVQDAGFAFSGLLFGVWKKYSATQQGMIVKDCQDRQVARIGYRTAQRQGWIIIEMADGVSFEADLKSLLHDDSVSLRPADDGSQSLCTFSRESSGIYRFEVPSIGVLESVPPPRPRVAPLFRYTMNGVPAGVSCHLGGIADRGRILVLPKKIPLSVRLFIVAMQGHRSDVLV